MRRRERVAEQEAVTREAVALRELRRAVGKRLECTRGGGRSQRGSQLGGRRGRFAEQHGKALQCRPGVLSRNQIASVRETELGDLDLEAVDPAGDAVRCGRLAAEIAQPNCRPGPRAEQREDHPYANDAFPHSARTG